MCFLVFRLSFFSFQCLSIILFLSLVCLLFFQFSFFFNFCHFQSINRSVLINYLLHGSLYFVSTLLALSISLLSLCASHQLYVVMIQEFNFQSIVLRFSRVQLIVFNLFRVQYMVLSDIYSFCVQFSSISHQLGFSIRSQPPWRFHFHQSSPSPSLDHNRGFVRC